MYQVSEGDRCSSSAHSLDICVAKGCQLTESLGRVTNHCCVDVSGEHMIITTCIQYMYVLVMDGVELLISQYLKIIYFGTDLNLIC